MTVRKGAVGTHSLGGMNVFVNQNYYLHRRARYMSVICGADPRFSYIRNAKSTHHTYVYRSRFSGLTISIYSSRGTVRTFAADTRSNIQTAQPLFRTP